MFRYDTCHGLEVLRNLPETAKGLRLLSCFLVYLVYLVDDTKRISCFVPSHGGKSAGPASRPSIVYNSQTLHPTDELSRRRAAPRARRRGRVLWAQVKLSNLQSAAVSRRLPQANLLGIGLARAAAAAGSLRRPRLQKTSRIPQARGHLPAELHKAFHDRVAFNHDMDFFQKLGGSR